MKVRIKRIDKSLPLPIHETKGSVGFDLITNTAMKYFKEHSNSPSDPLYSALLYGKL